ncbi:MAG TPA: hypothetical protein DCZ94_01765 [Lentisphaeria bacterium]|nr:MAG: hypothetical protein A2X48_21645 [Lentisphaerae bacterium GWF2_49_21]HBC85659.1 hypothetical protein [Lentisphaeria bacterium]
MPEFVHKHGCKNAAEAKKLVEEALKKSGYSEYIEWKGDSFASTEGVKMLLELEGHITKTDFIVEKSGGAFGDTALDECKKIAASFK